MNIVPDFSITLDKIVKKNGPHIWIKGGSDPEIKDSVSHGKIYDLPGKGRYVVNFGDFTSVELEPEYFPEVYRIKRQGNHFTHDATSTLLRITNKAHAREIVKTIISVLAEYNCA